MAAKSEFSRAKQAFISYVAEDKDRVDKLCRVLDAANVSYWRDRNELGPGEEWKRTVREAIGSGAMVFLACFSDRSRAKQKSYMNEEITLAVGEYRLRAPGQKWLIPVRFDAGKIPDWDLGAGRMLGDLNYVDLFGKPYTENAFKLVQAINAVMGVASLDPETVRAVEEVSKEPAAAQAVDEEVSKENPFQLREAARNEATETRGERSVRIATWVGSISGVVAAVVALLVWAPWKGESKTNGAPTTSNQVGINTNSGQVVVGGGGINNYGPPPNNDPRAQIVQLTGSWSEDGFVNAIVDRDTSLVDLYLKSGMKATTLDQGASAILFGFQGVPQNGDPVALVKTFQANGFKVDDQLQDSRRNPPIFESPLLPKGYAGGQGGTFVGTLLFWIVERASWNGVSDDDSQVTKYLISQGADCKVPLSYLDSVSYLHDDDVYKKMHPVLQSCAK